MTTSKTISLALGPVAFLLVRLLAWPDGLGDAGNAVLASTVWMAIWWITEAIPIAATALLPIVLFPMTGGLDLQSTTASFGHRLIFLYVGGFLIAIAIEKWNLHRRIALKIIALIGCSPSRVILGFMVATASLSMWISNTATAVMMLPIGMAVVSQLSAESSQGGANSFGKALMLAIAYSASIGGMATLVGTPPNLVLAGAIDEIYGIELSFFQWMIFGLPISLCLLAVCWFYLTRVVLRVSPASVSEDQSELGRQFDIQYDALGAISRQEKCVLIVFALTALGWIARSFLQSRMPMLSALDDTIIAMVGGIALFIVPAGESVFGRDQDSAGDNALGHDEFSRTAAGTSRGLLDWEDSKQLPWGIVLLFGGGMALASGFRESGLATWIGSQMTLLQGVSMLTLLLVLITAVNFLTEITSNLATTSMLMPVLAPMALAIDVHPYLLMVSATVAASCAFMLPVATPPNSVVFGSGYLRIPDMVKVGIAMNLISIGLLTLMVFWLLPWLWEIQPDRFPDELRIPAQVVTE